MAPQAGLLSPFVMRTLRIPVRVERSGIGLQVIASLTGIRLANWRTHDALTNMGSRHGPRAGASAPLLLARANKQEAILKTETGVPMPFAECPGNNL